MVAAKLEEKVRELEVANRQLIANETRHRHLSSSIRDVIIITDLSRVIIDANQPALRDVFGYETEEVVGKRPDFLYASHEAFALTGQDFFELLDP